MCGQAALSGRLRLIDKLLSFTLDLNRLDAATKAKVIKIINAAQKELISDLASKNLTAFGKARRDALLKDARNIIESYYAQAQMELFDTLEPIPELTAKQTVKALQSKLPASIQAALPTENVFKSLASDSLVLGATSTEWWKKQSADTVFRYNSAVRQGLTLGESNNQIISRVRQVLDVSRRNAAGLVQTSVSTVANASRQATFDANSDIIKGTKWISALDSRVCELCLARADKEWDNTGKPIGHGIPFSVPPIHYNDRCILTAVTKTFRELGVDIDEPPITTRASVDGQVSAKTTIDDFLKRKGEAWQNETLGKGRADLWREGKISLENLIDGSGQPLTVAQLRAKYG